MKINLRDRDSRISSIYNFYILNKDIEMWKLANESLDEETFQTTYTIIKDIELLEDIIIKYLPSSWTIDRLDSLTRAVLINGLAEIELFANFPNPVIVESLKYIDKYSIEDSKPIVNAILDTYSKTLKNKESSKE